MSARKDAGALQRELLRKDEQIQPLQHTLDRASSAPSMGSWRNLDLPEDTEGKTLRDAVDILQKANSTSKNENESLMVK